MSGNVSVLTVLNNFVLTNFPTGFQIQWEWGNYLLFKEGKKLLTLGKTAKEACHTLLSIPSDILEE